MTDNEEADSAHEECHGWQCVDVIGNVPEKDQWVSS
jgi:hypothetical protein